MFNKMVEEEDPTKYHPIHVEELNYTSEWMIRVKEASNEFDNLCMVTMV